MIKGKKARVLRLFHRYLGIILGVQFLFWTISGLYFSWTNIDEIHGDQFKVIDYKPDFNNKTLFPLSGLDINSNIQLIELREVNDTPHYWINNRMLFNALTGEKKDGVSESEAIGIAGKNIISTLEVKNIEIITETGKHHEYRERPLPAYVISYEHPDEIKAYVSQADGKFQTVRHKSWRWFDFLWMIHTMDYYSRDNFNTFLLRAFSLLAVVTVISGFVLWFISSKTVRKIRK